MRWREVLLLGPAAVIAAGMLVEVFGEAAWADVAPFAMAPISACSIIAYFWIERKRP